MVCIAFDNYSGPELYYNADQQPVVPILSSTRDFMQGNTPCTRTQFPLAIAFAITVHKSQGLSVEKAVVDISGTEFTSGLNYVAVSRLKTIEGLLFERPFDLDTIRKGGKGKTAEARQLDWVRRTAQVIPM